MKYVKNILHFIPLHVCACLKTEPRFLLHVCACLTVEPGFPLHVCACLKAGFNAATCLCLSQGRTWISNAKCSVCVCVQLSEVTCGCSFC